MSLWRFNKCCLCVRVCVCWCVCVCARRMWVWLCVRASARVLLCVCVCAGVRVHVRACCVQHVSTAGLYLLPIPMFPFYKNNNNVCQAWDDKALLQRQGWYPIRTEAIITGIKVNVFNPLRLGWITAGVYPHAARQTEIAETPTNPVAPQICMHNYTHANTHTHV